MTERNSSNSPGGRRFSGKASKHSQYTVSLYVNDDVYTHVLFATRIAINGESIAFYDIHEHVIAVFPARFTVVERVINK
jgi:hypothetical protein